MKHYLVDIERGEYLSVGEFLISQIEAAELTQKEIICQLKEVNPSYTITKGFLSQLTSDREKIPFGLITPLLNIVLCEKQTRVRKYYISELLKTYLPADLKDLVASPLQSLRDEAEQEARNSANWRIKDRRDTSIESKDDTDNWFELCMRPKLLAPVDFELFEKEGIELNTYKSKRDRKKQKRIRLSNSADADRSKDSFVISNEFIELVERSRIANEAAAKNRHGLFSHMSRARHGDCLANAIIQMQNGKPMYFQHKFTKEGRTLPDPAFLALCCETYCTNGGDASQFEKLLTQYFEDEEQKSKGVLFNPDEEPYIDTWKSNGLFKKERRDKLLEDHRDALVITIEDSRAATAKAFNGHYFFQMDRFFEDNKRSLFRLRYQKAKENILRNLVRNWNTENLLLVDILEQSTSTHLYQKLLSKDVKQKQHAYDELKKTWANCNSDPNAADEWNFWYEQEGPAPTEMREELCYQRYSWTFFHFFEQQLWKLKNNVHQIKP